MQESSCDDEHSATSSFRHKATVPLEMTVPLEISCSETAALVATHSPPLLIDCREREEYHLVHLPGATLLPMSEIAARFGELAGREEHHLIVYCHHGMRSAQVAMWLRGQGFANVQSMAGGIDRWAIDIEPGMVRY